MTNAEKSLQTISELQDNWNEYGAEAFPEKQVKKARKLLNKFPLEPDLIAPTGRGTIQFMYENPNEDYLEFELYRDGRLKLFVYTHNNTSILNNCVAYDHAVEIVEKFFDLE